MRDLFLIGIGTGNPDHVTREAQNALRQAVAVLVPRKGPDKSDLAELRLQILADAKATAKIIPFEYPVRDPDLPYQERVEAWHDDIATRWSAALEDAPDGPVALLVWGDPALYDSTIRIAERLADLSIRVIPGITSIQALAAAHSLPLSTVGGGFSVTTGRVLRASGWPDGVETLVVMLDGDCAFQDLAGDGYDIWWGAFLGMEEQLLIAGPLEQVATQIVAERAEARAEHGWIMDTYILRRR
ncbi:MAG: precorrin-6A synthase (deacetylating) [Pseudomonadota bacterium]